MSETRAKKAASGKVRRKYRVDIESQFWEFDDAESARRKAQELLSMGVWFLRASRREV